MFGLILGVFVIILGAKAFTPSGIPLTKAKNLTGVTAKIIGVVCILLGLVFLADGLFATFSIFSLLRGGGS